ncbi:type IV pilus inner membrane component PilO [Thermus filiformis]|uniref:Competence protein n=1 Tax=Thermus filiformis TaxID=276 RepID=A0A0A2WQL9_THEFI|nr:type 4a pilus biogenesis protein PilO [Thermus filiformis]KGQ21052.2 competence protein [Thermus filiformis]
MLARSGFLRNLGQREWALLSILLVALLGLAWYYFLITPMREEIARVQSEIDQLTLERNRGLQAQRALPELRAALAQLQAERAAFLRALPPEERLYAVLNELSQEALRSGVVLKSFTRSPTSAPVPEVRAVSLALQLEAPFPETYAFLRRLEGLSRFSTVSGLNLSVAGQDLNPTLNTSLTLTLYMLARGTQVEGEGSPPGGGR